MGRKHLAAAPVVESVPATSMWSLTETGTPSSSGASVPDAGAYCPRSSEASISRARASAASYNSSVSALTASAPPRARQRRTKTEATCDAESFRERMACTRSDADEPRAIDASCMVHVYRD